MFKQIILIFLLMVSLIMAGCSSPEVEPTPAPVSEADLTAVKQYALDNAQQMKQGTTNLLTAAQAYYDLAASSGFDYQAMWDNNTTEAAQLVADAQAAWVEASTHYELDEGIIAGVPSLASYDVWIDAGPSAEEDPAEAYEWTLELPDGRSLTSPGNFFHSLLEPTIWGTNPEFTGLAVDLDGDGAVELGEALPEANMLLGAAQGLDGATSEMITAVTDWQPSLSDAFTALVVMIPTMNEYFEQWKLSSYIAGSQTQETAFIGASRLFDINGILNGLDITYDNVADLVADSDPNLHGQIADGFDDLRGYVSDLYTQEQNGTRFTAEQADLFGTEAQNKATALAGQVSQAAVLLNITIEE
ncbi:MAG: EfeM/EfeO family lipoprotein [Ardenticatenaceae bacterium]|nr:EfeM/EfeO family lipoprotein [Ardenticatenaceae bacterium]